MITTTIENVQHQCHCGFVAPQWNRNETAMKPQVAVPLLCFCWTKFHETATKPQLRFHCAAMKPQRNRNCGFIAIFLLVPGT